MILRFHHYSLISALFVVGSAASFASAATFTPFSFTSNTSTSGLFASSGVGGDLRLDSVGINANTLLAAQLQTVNSATILVDDGTDATNGGHNLASGRGIGSTTDSWAPEGPATVTPTSADLASSQANFNLSSLVVTRENVGTATVDYTFANPTNTFLYYERGIDSDATFEALDAGHNIIATYHILRGNETDTGLFLSTENGAFNVSNLKLGSIGLQLDQPVSEVIITSTQLTAGGAGLGDDGPDYKLLATAGSIAAVPEPSSMAFVSLSAIALVKRRPRGARSK